MHRLDEDRVVDFAVGVMTAAQQVAVGFEQGLGLAAVEPLVQFGGAEAGAVLDHAHEDGGQVVLPFHRVAGGDGLVDVIHEAAAVLEIVETDLGQFGNGSVGLLDHIDDQIVPQHIDAETLVILHFLGVDQAVAVGAEFGDALEFGDEDGVVEDHQHVVPFMNVLPRQGNGVGRAETILLHDVATGDLGKLLLHAGLDLLAVLVGDEDQLDVAEHQQAADDMFEDGLAGHVNQGFGLGMGVRAQAGTLAGDGKNDFHGRSDG